MLPIDYALQNIKGIKESLDQGVEDTFAIYMGTGIVDVYTTDETFEIYTTTEGLSGSKKLSSFETPPSSSLQDGYSVTITESRFGNGIDVPEEVYRRGAGDNSTKVPNYLIRQKKQLLLDLKELLVSDLHTFFNDGFTGAELLAPDGNVLFGPHTWATPGAPAWDNSTNVPLTDTAIDAMETYGGAFQAPSSTAANRKYKAKRFDTILVKHGSDNHREAIRLFAKGIVPTTVADINIYEGQYTIVSTPYIDTALNWFAYASNMDNPFKLGVGEYPTMRNPIVDKNEAIRVNVTGFWKQGCVFQPEAWYGSTGS